MKLNCIIIDDEPVARKGIAEYIAEIDFLELVGEFGNPLKAPATLKKEKIDLIFLDIQMPKMNGIDFLKAQSNSPMVIITTAFPEYALEGFELDVLDYLVKPLRYERFLKACNKAKEFYELKQKPVSENAASENFFFVKCNSKFEKINYDELLYAEALENYVVLHTTEKRLVSYLTFKGVEEYLPKDKFIRVHKSYIISLSKINNIDGDDVYVGEKAIPIGRNYKEDVIERIVNGRLMKR